MGTQTTLAFAQGKTGRSYGQVFHFDIYVRKCAVRDALVVFLLQRGGVQFLAVAVRHWLPWSWQG
jgi:hypothetical protein